MNASLAEFLTRFERQVRAARGTSAVREVGAPTRWRHAVNAAQRAVDLGDQASAAHHAVAWCEWPAIGDATSWASYLAWGRAQTAALRVGNLHERVLKPALRRKRSSPEIYAPDGESFALAVSKSGSLGAYPAFWGVDAIDAPVCLVWFFELVQDLLTGLTLQPNGQLT